MHVKLTLQATTGSLILHGPGVLQVLLLLLLFMFVLLSLSLSLSLKILLLTLPPSPFIRSDSCDEWGGGRDTPSPPPFPPSNSPFPSPPDDAGRMKDILKTGDYYRFKLDLEKSLKILQDTRSNCLIFVSGLTRATNRCPQVNQLVRVW